MSSFGAGGGSMTGSTGGMVKQLMKGLGLDNPNEITGQPSALGKKAADPEAAVQPGQMANLSPQQRFALIQRMYARGGVA